MLQKFWFWSEQLKQKGNLENKDSIVVYSFRRFNEHTLSDLIERKITVCRPSKMNDPLIVQLLYGELRNI